MLRGRLGQARAGGLHVPAADLVVPRAGDEKVGDGRKREARDAVRGRRRHLVVLVRVVRGHGRGRAKGRAKGRHGLGIGEGGGERREREEREEKESRVSSPRSIDCVFFVSLLSPSERKKKKKEVDCLLPLKQEISRLFCNRKAHSKSLSFLLSSYPQPSARRPAPTLLFWIEIRPRFRCKTRPERG